MVKGYYTGDITDRREIHENYMKLARILIESTTEHILGTHNLTKIRQLYSEYPLMYHHIHLGYLYYVHEYYDNQIKQSPELAKFNVIPQI